MDDPGEATQPASADQKLLTVRQGVTLLAILVPSISLDDGRKRSRPSSRAYVQVGS